MKIVILGAAGCYHIDKWVIGLAERGIDIKVISLVEDLGYYKEFSNVSVHSFGYSDDFIARKSQLNKISFFRYIFKIRKIVREFNPDLVHSHFLSSYGFLHALCFLNKPFLTSVWGSDIYDFPKKSILHKLIIKFILKRANQIYSTSNCMAEETLKYTQKPIKVIPFGIDIVKFKPKNKIKQLDKKPIIIGTIKSLTPKYGIDVLIQAFHEILLNYNNDLRLVIVGKGTAEQEYKALVNKLKIDEYVDFFGYIDNSKVPDVLNSLDIYVALSTLDSESFGVAVVEAMACELPVVVSSVDGFKEVVPDDSGIIVPKNNIKAAAVAISELIYNSEKRKTMGVNGRKNVLRKYVFSDNLDVLLNSYDEIYRKLL